MASEFFVAQKAIMYFIVTLSSFAYCYRYHTFLDEVDVI